MRLARIHFWLLALAITVTLAMIANAMLGVFFVRQADIPIAISLIVGGYALVGLACAAVHDNGRLRRLMRIAILIAALATVGWIGLAIVQDWRGLEMLVVALVGLSCAACSLAIIGMLALFPLNTPMHRGMRIAAIVSVLALAAFITGAMAFSPGNRLGGWSPLQWDSYYEYEERMYAYGGVITLISSALILSTIIVGIVDVLSARGRPSAHPPRAYWLECPRCRRSQQAMTGEHLCEGCRLRVKVDLT